MIEITFKVISDEWIEAEMLGHVYVRVRQALWIEYRTCQPANAPLGEALERRLETTR